MTAHITLSLSGRTCLVIGGGGGGIGTAMVVAAATAGADVGVVTSVAEHAEDSAARVTAIGRRCATAVADATIEEGLVGAIASVRERLGPIQHLINVVGGNLADDWYRSAEIDMAAFDRVVARNFRYVAVACREVAAPLLRDGLSGSIVSVSSISARGTPLLATYGAAKAALESYSRTLALEWGAKGIRVNIVAAGTVRTPRAGTGDLADAAARQIPLGRRGNPEDIANAAVFLLSDLASYVTGHTLTVDGGSSLGSSHGDTLPVFVTNPAVRARFDTP